MKKVEWEGIPRIQFFDLLPNSFILLKLFNIRKFEANPKKNLPTIS